MKRIFKTLLMVFVFLVSSLWAAPFSLLPCPREMSFGAGHLQLSDDISIFYSENISADFSGLALLSETLLESAICKQPCSMTTVANPNDDYRVSIGLTSLASFAEDSVVYFEDMVQEGYYLRVDPGAILIRAPSQQGLFYGLMTLRQMIESSPAGLLPAVDILDYPAMQWRAVSDDISRGQVSTMENFQQIILFLAEHKFNCYMPYLEDLVLLQKCPDIGEGRGALAAAELQELQQFAQKYFVEIVPIFQTLGHFENILNMSRYLQYAEYPGAASLNTIDSRADRFLFAMLDEVVPIFDSPYFHIGADESWDVGRGATRPLLDSVGIARLHSRHYNKVYQQLTGAGKQVMMYGDIILRHPEILTQIPRDIIIVDWHYWPVDSYPSVRQFKEAGFRVLVSPGIHNWRRSFPDFQRAWTNVQYIHRAGIEFDALGTVISNWGDYGGPNLREYNYLGYLYGVATAWNPSADDKFLIDSYYFQSQFGTDDVRLHSLLLDLNEITQSFDFKEFWAHPFYLPEKSPGAVLQESQNMRLHSRNAIRLIDELRAELATGTEFLDYYRHSADLGLCLARQKEMARQRQLLLAENISEDRADQLRRELLRGCRDQLTSLMELEKQHRELWLRSNRPENLSRILNLYRRLQANYSSAINDLESENDSFPTVSPSQWITFSRDSIHRHVYLRKQFNLQNTEELQQANLQLVGNTDAKMYLNGQDVGRVCATKSLSLLVENQRVGWWRVTDFLQSGENVLAVDVTGYYADRPAAANVYLDLQYQDGEKRLVLSDTSWQAGLEPVRGWKGAKFGEPWQNAVEYQDYPWRLSVPMFDRGFAARLEF